jgi:uncharacterized membrane protein YfcA
VESLVSVPLVFATFFVAGLVKGAVGLGLQTVSVALLTAECDLPTAMTLLVVPSFATNAWQAAVGGHARHLLSRFWPFFAAASAAVWIGAALLARVETLPVTALLGGALIVYSLTSLGDVRINVPKRSETWVGVLSGLLNGVITGLTGSFVLPGVLFLHAAGLARDELVQAIGILFTTSTLALALALQHAQALSLHDGALSAAALLPAFAGMGCGRALRSRLSEARFRSVLFALLLALGVCLVALAFAGER